MCAQVRVELNLDEDLSSLAPLVEVKAPQVHIVCDPRQLEVNILIFEIAIQ